MEESGVYIVSHVDDCSGECIVRKWVVEITT